MVAKRLFGVLAGLALVVGSNHAWALTGEDEFNRPGAYVGLGASGFISGFQGLLGRADFGNTAGFNIRGGYRLNPFFAAEAVYEYGNSFGASRTGTVGRQEIFGASSIQTNGFSVGAKLILPLGRFQPYLGGGVGFVNANGNLKIRDDNTGRSVRASDSGTGFAGRFGGGIDVFINEKWSVFADNAYTITATGPTDVYYYSFGVGGRYNF